jgi:hypothetical protein
MVEAIQCPSCQTRYGLRPVRVRSGLRRAQCFRCGDVFHIEPEVKRLLAEMEPASTANVPLAALAEAIHQAPEHQVEPQVAAHHDGSAPTPTLEAHDLALGDLELPEPEMEMASPAETAPIPAMTQAMAPAMTLAMPLPPEPSPEPAMADFELPSLPEPELAAAAEEAPSASGSYSSARDAIARLFGDTPLGVSPTANLRNALDMDAGMKALEDTLGGVKADSLSTKPFAASVAQPMEEAELSHASATMRMTAAEVASATGSAPFKAPEPPEITQEEVTMVLPPPAPAVEAAPDPSALRLRIGDQVYSGLDLPTIAKWIEEGRVLEDHQVARGMSENWMDAAKVPALRSVFDRLRRERLGIGDMLPPPPAGIADIGSKRGLFGGMFGKKD